MSGQPKRGGKGKVLRPEGMKSRIMLLGMFLSVYHILLCLEVLCSEAGSVFMFTAWMEDTGTQGGERAGTAPHYELEA